MPGLGLDIVDGVGEDVDRYLPCLVAMSPQEIQELQPYLPAILDLQLVQQPLGPKCWEE